MISAVEAVQAAKAAKDATKKKKKFKKLKKIYIPPRPEDFIKDDIEEGYCLVCEVYV